jgi:hypothetical protein
MPAIFRNLGNEEGSIIAVAMVLLALLTLIGIVSTNTSTTEVQIATNGQNAQMVFLLADSGWRQGAIWLENRGGPPIWVNTGDNVVKNYGSGTPANPTITDLKALTPDNSNLSHYSGFAYYYRVEHLDPAILGGSSAAEGNEKGFERFFYEITSRGMEASVNANSAQEVRVRTSKVYKVGY